MKLTRTLALCLSALLFAHTMPAAEHIVPLQDLHRKAADQSRTRAGNIGKLQAFLDQDSARKALAASGMDAAQVRNAASLLSDDELASLAARAEQANNHFAAGSLSNQELTYIVIALATAVIILVIVAA